MSDFQTLLAQLPMRHQRVVQAYVKHGTWADASREVGVSTATGRRVKKRCEQLGILDALTAEVAGQVEIDVEVMIKRFEVIRDEARAAKQFTPAVKAEETYDMLINSKRR